MAIGLPTPRPALRLVKSQQQTRLLHSNDPNVDLTERMQQFSERRVSQLQTFMGGYISLRKITYLRHGTGSSSGTRTARGAHKSGVGLFAAELLQQMPWLPVEERRSSDRSRAAGKLCVERVFALL
ncbi:Uncharacterized conserved protein [Serratia fonticola]|uniref:Uncharacterized conserved protein n=1 Tax=Serratia fonticola TaxID=47917 RepID=A0A4U9UJA6_SERFO|nr:Uncharacterized conserved protein [Serratia fonticola]